MGLKGMYGVPTARLHNAEQGTSRGIYIVEIIGMHIQAYEFAARLAESEAGGERMYVNVEAFDLIDRQLVEPEDWFAFRRKTASFATWTRPQEVERSELIADAHELAVKKAKELLHRFDPQLGDDALRKLVALVKR